MIAISIEDAAKKITEINYEDKYEVMVEALKKSEELKQGGILCMACEMQSIWAFGTAMTGSAMCFSCTTGEADHSEDYELESVCF